MIEWLKKTIGEMTVEIAVPVRVYKRWGTPGYWEQLERELEYEIKELQEFIRDHRSRDDYHMTVIKKHIFTCAFCGHEYGDTSEPDKLTPICCTEAMEMTGYAPIDYDEYIKGDG